MGKVLVLAVGTDERLGECQCERYNSKGGNAYVLEEPGRVRGECDARGDFLLERRVIFKKRLHCK